MRREEKKKKREMRLDRERNILKSLNKEEREKKKILRKRRKRINKILIFIIRLEHPNKEEHLQQWWYNAIMPNYSSINIKMMLQQWS